MEYEYCPPIWNEAADLTDLEEIQESEQAKATDKLRTEDYENGFMEADSEF